MLLPKNRREYVTYDENVRINNAADAKHLRRLDLFEFYSAGGLRSEVVQDAVHTGTHHA